jgi:hypothetical protein
MHMKVKIRKQEGKKTVSRRNRVIFQKTLSHSFIFEIKVF